MCGRGNKRYERKEKEVERKKDREREKREREKRERRYSECIGTTNDNNERKDKDDLKNK